MKIFSLKENHLFSKTYMLGRKVVGKRIVLYVLPDKNAYLVEKKNPLKEKLNRVGITASKKIGGAVQRNRVKRIIREAYRRLEKENELKKGFLVVVSARTAALYGKTEDVYKELLDAAERLDLIESKKL